MDLEMNMKLIFTVMNTTQAGVKIRPKSSVHYC